MLFKYQPKLKQDIILKVLECNTVFYILLTIFFFYKFVGDLQQNYKIFRLEHVPLFHIIGYSRRNPHKTTAEIWGRIHDLPDPSRSSSGLIEGVQ